MPAFDPVGSAPVGGTGGAGFLPASLTLTGATPAVTYVLPTYSVPTYVAAGSIAQRSGGTAPTIINVPYPATGVFADNFAVILAGELTDLSTGGVLSAPAGWTQLFQFSPGATAFFAGFYRVLDGTESGTVAIACSVAPSAGNTTAFVGVMHVWTGTDAVTPFEGLVTNGVSDGGASTMTGGSVTSLGPNRKFVNLYVLGSVIGGSGVGSPGSGWTDDLNSVAIYGAVDRRGFVVDESAIAPLPTTHGAETRSKSGFNWWSYASMALRPGINQPTIFRPPFALLSLAGQVTNATSDGTAATTPAHLILGGTRAFVPDPAHLALFGVTPHVIFPGTSGDDVVVAYVW